MPTSAEMTGRSDLMPELPSVEGFRNYINSTSLHTEIDAIEVLDEYLLEGTTTEELASVLEGSEFIDTDRRGKYLFLDIADGGWLIWHFGMTGFPRYFLDEEKEPEHDRFLVTFTDGYHLAYDCQRKLGQVSLADDMQQFIAEQDLGPDALEIEWEQFRETMSSTRGMIKTRLMDQSKITGIGNVYSDEVIFQMRLPPKATMADLDENGLREMYDTMKRVLETATDGVIHSEGVPSSFLAGHREVGSDCPRCDGTIERIEVGGRAARYCPKCQGES